MPFAPPARGLPPWPPVEIDPVTGLPVDLETDPAAARPSPFLPPPVMATPMPAPAPAPPEPLDYGPMPDDVAVGADMTAAPPVPPRAEPPSPFRSPAVLPLPAPPEPERPAPASAVRLPAPPVRRTAEPVAEIPTPRLPAPPLTPELTGRERRQQTISTRASLSAGPVDHSSREAFIRSMLPYAKQAEAATGFPAEIMIAINLNEQGWRTPAPGNNYFGIKGSNPRTGKNTGAVDTWEDYGRGRENIRDTFRAYDSPAESYADFAAFLRSNVRYAPALAAFERDDDAAELIRGIKKAGYATDPKWPDKILSIAGEVRSLIGKAPGATPPSSGGGKYGVLSARLPRPGEGGAALPGDPEPQGDLPLPDGGLLAPPEFPGYAPPAPGLAQPSYPAPQPPLPLLPALPGQVGPAGRDIPLAEGNPELYRERQGLPPLAREAARLPDLLATMAPGGDTATSPLPEGLAGALNALPGLPSVPGTVGVRGVGPGLAMAADVASGLLGGPSVASLDDVLRPLAQGARLAGQGIADVLREGELLGPGTSAMTPPGYRSETLSGGIVPPVPGAALPAPGTGGELWAMTRAEVERPLPYSDMQREGTYPHPLNNVQISDGSRFYDPKSGNIIRLNDRYLAMKNMSRADFYQAAPSMSRQEIYEFAWAEDLRGPVGEERYWFRYGPPPKNNRSWNAAENRAEAGVSVYPTAYPSSFAGLDFEGKRTLYYGKGRQIGWGSDEEPLIIPSGEWKPFDHKALVQQAFLEGKPVPPEVLADYPEIMAKAKRSRRPGIMAAVEQYGMRLAGIDPATGRRSETLGMSLGAPPPGVSQRAAPTPNQPGRVIPPPPADNVLGLRSISTGLTRRDQLVNSFKRTLGVGVEAEEHVTPAFRERARLQPVVESQAAALAEQASERTRRAFVTDAEGRIPALKDSAPGGLFPDGPTVQDVAARLPVFEARLTPEQRAALDWLRQAMHPYRALWDEVGAKALHSRIDVMNGGFYLPRMRAGERAGFWKPATYDSQAQGIADGVQYASLHDSLQDHINAAGRKIVDQHIANYLAAATDDSGALLHSTMADRIDPQLRDQVTDLRSKIFARRHTLAAQNVRARMAGMSAEQVGRQAARAQEMLDRAQARFEARLAGQNTDEVVKAAERELKVLEREAERRADTAGGAAERAVRAGERATEASDAPQVTPDSAALVGAAEREMRLRTSQAKTDAAAATMAERQLKQARDRLIAADARNAPKPVITRLRGEIAAREQAVAAATRRAEATQGKLEAANVRRFDVGEQDVKGRGAAKRVADREQLILEREAKRDQKAADMARQRADAAQVKLDEAIAKNRPDAVTKAAQREALVRKWELENADARAQASADRAAIYIAERDATQAELRQYSADLAALRGRWQHAQRVASTTPRGAGQIDLLPLQGKAFPDALADAANAELRAERPLQGKGAAPLRVVNALNNLYRSVGATADNSVLGIQGLLGLASDPAAYGKALKVNMQAWGRNGDRALGAFLVDFDDAARTAGMATAGDWARAGLHVGGTSSEFAVGPGIGALGHRLSNAPVIQQAGRAFGFFGDALRLEWAQDELKAALRSGPGGTARTLAQLEASGELAAIAKAINGATGWSPAKFANDWGEVAMFAPRFFQSRLETVARAAKGLRPGATLEQRIARNSLLKLMAGGTLLTVAVNHARGEETDFRPYITTDQGERRRNPNFLRIRNLAGQDWAVFGTWDSLLGMFLDTAAGNPMRAMRGVSSGSVKISWDLITGKDAMGRPVPNSPSKIAGDPGAFAAWIARSFSPFSWQDLPELAGEGMEAAGKGDAAGVGATAAVAVGKQFLGVKGSEFGYSDTREQIARAMYNGEPWDKLAQGQRREVNKAVELQTLKADFQPQDTGTVEQRAAAAYQRATQQKDELEKGMRAKIDAGMTGKALREAIQEFKRDRFVASSALIAPEIREATKRKNKPPQDVYAEEYWSVPLPVTPGVNGEDLDFNEQERGRLDVLQRAVADGVDPEYITGTGPKTFRGERFADPAVRKAVEQLEQDQKTLRPYWALADRLQENTPAFRAVAGNVDALPMGSPRRKAAEQNKTYRYYQRDLSDAREALRRRDPAMQAAGVRWGYFGEQKPVGPGGRPLRPTERPPRPLRPLRPGQVSPEVQQALAGMGQ